MMNFINIDFGPCREIQPLFYYRIGELAFWKGDTPKRIPAK